MSWLVTANEVCTEADLVPVTTTSSISAVETMLTDSLAVSETVKNTLSNDSVA